MTRAVKVGDTVAFALKTTRRGVVVGERLRNKGVVTRLYQTKIGGWHRADVIWDDKALAFLHAGSSTWAYVRDLRVIDAS